MGSVRVGPSWEMTSEEFDDTYKGTFDHTVFSDREYQRIALYLGEVGFSHDADWVLTHYPEAASSGNETWLLEPLVLYASVGPSGSRSLRSSTSSI